MMQKDQYNLISEKQNNQTQHKLNQIYSIYEISIAEQCLWNAGCWKLSFFVLCIHTHTHTHQSQEWENMKPVYL